MTIRKRLYLSNILMVATPILLTILVVGAFFLTLSQTFGNDFYQQWQQNEAYTKAYEHMEELQEAKNSRDLPQQLQQFHDEHPNPFLSLLVYDKSGKLIQQLGSYQADELTQQMGQGQQQVNSLSLDQLRIDRFFVGAETVLLVNTDYHSLIEEELIDHKDLLKLAFFSALVLGILFVTVTNFYLARFIYRPINVALDILTDGVNQLAAGNLDWRIDYAPEDEFKAVVANFNDMARRLQQMVALQEKNSESHKELIAGISHDLRTPLTAIKAYVEGLEQGVAATPVMQARYLQTISQKTDHLNQLVDQLFLFSKLDLGDYPFRLETLDIGRFLSSFVNSLKAEYRQRGLTITLEISSWGEYVRADPAELRSVFLNLLENTLKYGNLADNQLRISQFSREQTAVIRFVDNGPGIAADQQEAIFDVFYRGDKARTQPNQGSGLGLAIAKKIIEGQAGQIAAGSSPTGGLLIEIRLPLQEEPSHEEHSDH